MGEKISGGPSVQSIPKGSEWEERCRRFFAEDPGWATVSHEYPPGAASHLEAGASPPATAEWWGLMAGLAVLRGMVLEQRGIDYEEARAHVLDLLDARTALDAYDRNPDHEGGNDRQALSAHLHSIFGEVVGLVAQSDRWAHRSVRTGSQAEAMATELVDSVLTARGRGVSLDVDPGVTGARADLVAALVQTPDWQTRALAAEDRLEGAEYLLGGLKTAVRELAGPGATCLSDVRNRLDTLEGERLAAEQRRDEMAAHVLQIREVLGRLRTFEMPEDVEMVHHSVMASPRSAETERLAQACIDGQVRKAYAGLQTEHAAREAGLVEQVRTLEFQLSVERGAYEVLAEKSAAETESNLLRIRDAEKSRDDARRSTLFAGAALIVASIVLAVVASGLLHSA